VPLSRLPSALTALKRAVRFATYDWTGEMAPLRRVITMVGMGLQAYAGSRPQQRARMRDARPDRGVTSPTVVAEAQK
jgi:hypothetical protein